MKKVITLILLVLLPLSVAAYTLGRVSVHDPSIVWEPTSQTYYIFGSFRKVAKTNDMMNWTEVASGTDPEGAVGVPWKVGDNNNAPSADAFSTPAVTKVTVRGEEKDLPAFDAKAWSAKGTSKTYDITGNLWAPDVIWNPVMQKWCMYMSVNGDGWYSSIVLLTADAIEGPYTYQAPIVISGFYNDDDYKLTDLELVLGQELDALPSRYAAPWAHTSKPSYPNNIDACVFYDETGKLWMSYGSWSGGIFMLELDENTGLRDYDVSYDTSDTSDPYFGKKIAGGYYSSGEASYIEYINGYYYLFLSYGGLQAGGVAGDNNYGGYQMRVFRSKSPDGPYLDSKNASAVYDSYRLNFGANANDNNRGENIFGCYGNWGYQTRGIYSERSQGHNSIIAAPDGRTYLVHHSRFQNLGESHEVRVHQVFQNEDNWLVAAPFEYTGETVKSADIAGSQQIATANIPGHYKLLVHRYGLDHTAKETVTPVEIELKSDGTVTGAYTGTWTATAGTSYVQMTLDGTTYKGVMVEQTMEPTNEKVVAFTAMSSSNGVNIWGHQFTPVETLPEPVYFNDFSSTDGLTQVGSGEFVKDPDARFGMIYHNDPNLTKAVRTNYLKLPADVLKHSAVTKEMTIGFWINAENAIGTDFFHSPVFSAYATSTPGTENGLPMFRCSAKGVMQLNNGDGKWSDFTNDQNYKGINLETTAWLDDAEWHYYTVTLTATTATIYVDGGIVNSWTLEDGSIIPAFFSSAAADGYPVVCLGGNQSWNWNDIDASFKYDDFVVYADALTPEQIEKIMEEKYSNHPNRVYFNDFSSTEGLTIIGSGEFITDADPQFGQVYHNDPNNTSAVRTNYLKLPSDVLSHSAESREMTIGFWVNKKSEDVFFFSPLFAAYGAAPDATNGNTSPMFVCEARGLLQLNCNGWCDFGINDNPAGTSFNNGSPYVSTVWLDDGNWHYYTAVLTTTTAKVYIDGELKNGWTVDGTSDGQVISGLFTSGGTNLTYVTLGGNQAWEWNDPDPAFAFDDFAVYNKALTAEEIAEIIADKNYTPTYAYSVKASYGGNTKTLASGTGESGTSVTVAYPRYILDGTTLYEAAKQTSDYYHKSFTLSSNDQEEIITYSKSIDYVFYYEEGEAVMPATANSGGAGTRTSMGAVGRNPSGNSSNYTDVITLPAGKWQIGAHFYCGNTTGEHTANIKVGNDVKWTKTFANGSGGSHEYVTETFELTNDSQLSMAIDGGNATGIDWIYIKSAEPFEVVGETNFTTAYLRAYSTNYTLRKGETRVFTFQNHSNKSENYDNWLIVVNEGETQKAITRADFWDNILSKHLDADGNDGADDWALMSTDGGATKTNVNWDSFAEDMANARVVATVSYSAEGQLTINAVSTGVKNGYQYFVDNVGHVTGTGDMTVCLSVSNSWLEVISVSSDYEPVVLALKDKADNADAISANSGATVNVKLDGRTLMRTGDWNTLTLPFSVAGISGTPLEGATVKELDATASGLDAEGVMTLVFKDATGIEAGKPYIVKWEINTEGTELKDPLFTNVRITTTEPVAVTFSNNKGTGDCEFVGQFSPFAITNENINEIIFLGSGNRLGYSQNARSLNSFRAHFRVPSADGEPAMSRGIIDFGDGTTAIISPSSGSWSSDDSDRWYSIDGRRLTAKPTSKGIYINRNGKKMIKD